PVPLPALQVLEPELLVRMRLEHLPKRTAAYAPNNYIGLKFLRV
ncbi:hypothetical protein L917_05633, partial [Phytophthora nicotianae]